MSDTQVYISDYFRQRWRRAKAHAGMQLGWVIGLGGPAAIIWWLTVHHAPAGFFLAAAVPAVYGFVIFARAQLGLKPEFSEAAGNASWAQHRDLKRAGLIGSKINRKIHPYVGQFVVWSWLQFRRVRYDVHYPGAIHWTMCGPTGCGKDTGLICWNIFALDGLSKVILDIKGEAAVRCAGPLRKKGQQVICLNLLNLHAATRPDLASQGYNALEGFTVEHPNCYEMCKANSAAMIVRRDGESGHWDARAAALLTYCQLAMKWAEYDGQLKNAKGDRRSATLADVNQMLWAPYRYSGNKTEEPKDGEQPKPPQPNKKKIISLHEMIHETMQWEDKPDEPSRETLRFAANAFYSENPSDEEISGAIATAKGQLEPLISDTVRADMHKHPLVWITDKKTGKRVRAPFRFEYLRDEVIVVFIILPFDQRNELAIWTRLILSRAIQGLIKGETAPDVDTLMVINEAHSVGNLKILEESLSAVRYAGLHIWTIWQHFEQILKNFGHIGEFMANAGVLNSYRVGERVTAEEIRWRLGTTTAVTESVSSAPNSDAKQRNKTRQGAGVNLMNLEDLTGLGKRETICFMPEYIDKPIKLRTPLRLKGLDPFMEKKRAA